MMVKKHNILKLVCVFFLLIYTAKSVSQTTITKTQVYVYFAGSSKPYMISSLLKDGIIYSSLKELAQVFHLGYYENREKRKEVIRIGSKNITTTVYNPFILADDNVYQMPLVPYESEGRIYVPLAHYLNVIKKYLPQKVELNVDRLRMKVYGSLFNILAVDIGEKENGYLLTIHTSNRFSKSDVDASIRHGWLNVTIYRGKLDSLALTSKKKDKIIDQILPFQFEKSAYISFKLNKKILSTKVYTTDNEIQISLRTKEAVNIASTVLDGRKKKWLIDTIVIDPGHGGRQPGCIGQTGITEKEITLDIAKKLKSLLEKNLKVKVLLTRNSDKFMGLRDRTQFANKNNGKLFISIHANASPNRKARGFSTWVLGHGKSEQALQVAEKENSVIQFEDSPETYKNFGDAAHILNAIANSSYQKESMDLAQIVNKELGKYTKIPMWGKGVYQAGFYVLIGAAMPRILVETAFLSNKYEERLLRTKSFRRKIAIALYESIKKFKTKYEKGID